MKQAKGSKRFLSYIIDSSLIFFFFFICMKIGEIFVPQKDLYPPADRMSLFTPKELTVYFRACVITICFCYLYLASSYLYFKRTLGQQLLKIRVLNLDESRISNIKSFILPSFSIIKLIIIFLPGPVLIFILKSFSIHISGIDFAAFIMLLSGIFFLFANPGISYLKEDKASWVEKITKTRIFEL